jgi:hypothetical protein
MIRQIIRVDLITPDEMIFITPNKMYSYNSHLVKPDMKNLSPRSSGQIERLIFNIRQIYYRDKQQMPTDNELFDLISKTHN